MAYSITRTKDLDLYLGTVCNGSIAVGTTALTAAASLTQADVGNPVWVLGAGADTSPSTGDNAILYSTIASVEDADSCTIADAAITGIETGFNIVIVWRPVWALVDSIKLTRSLTVRDTLDFNIQQLVTEGTPILLADQSEVLFGGVVQKSRANNVPGTDDVDTLCTCVGWDYLFSKRQSGLFTYEGLTAGDVFAQLIVNSLGADYIGVQIDDAGPVIDSITFDYEPCSSAADRIVSLCNTELDTYYWYVDPLRVAHLAKQSTTAAPWGVDDADGSDENIRIEVSVERSNEKRYNRVYIKATQLLGLAVTEGIDGDGSSKQFSVSAPIGQEPTIELNGSAQTVGIQGVDTGKDWYWNKGSNVIYQDDAGATLSAGDHLSVVYKPYTQGLALYNYSADVDAVSAVEGGTGYYEKVVTVTAPTTEPAINALAEALAKKFGTKITAITATTNRSGLKPGMLWPVALSELDIDGSYLIDQVSLTSTSSVCYWQIHAVGSPLIGDWRKAFADLAKEDTDTRGAGAGNGGGGTIPPAQNPLDLIIEPLQGEVDGVNRLFTASYAARLSPTTGKPMRWVHRNQNTLCPFPAIVSPVTSIDYSNYGEGQFCTEGIEVIFAVAPQIGDRPWTSYFRDYNPPEEVAYPRTGVWAAAPEDGEASGPIYWVFGDTYYIGTAVGSRASLIHTNSLIMEYPWYRLFSFSVPDIDVVPGLSNPTPYWEYVTGNETISHTPGVDVAAQSEHHIGPGPMSGFGFDDYSVYLSDDEVSGLGLLELLGVHDDNGDSIPADILAWEFYSVIWHSQQSAGSQAAVMEATNPFLGFFFQAVRINCGGAALSTGQEGTYPAGELGVYTWAADGHYTGGEEFTGNGTGLYAKGRKGTSFRYTIGRNLFYLQSATSRYKVMLGFKEHEYASAGQRSINVSANGISKISGLDPYADHGTTAFTETFEIEIANLPDGRLYLDFEGATGEAIVNHIVVMPMVPTGVLG